MARKELEPGDITALIDTREQLPYNLSPLKTASATLATADYSVQGLESFIAIERKSLDDWLGVVGQGRERFERECQRLLAYETRAIIIEATWQDLEKGEWRSQIKPESAMGSALGWISAGIPVVFGGNRGSCEKIVSRMLFIAARRRWRQAQAFCDTLKIDTKST